MKNILYLESGEGAGGSSESMLLTIENLDARQYQPHVVFLNETHYAKKIREMGVPTFILHNPIYSRQHCLRRRIYMYILKGISSAFPPLYIPAFLFFHRSTVRALENIVETSKIDLIHLNVSIARDLFGVYVAKQTKVPCVSHLRSVKMLSFPKRAQYFANKYVCKYIAISDFVKTIWTSFGINESKCEVILNGIAPLSFTKKKYAEINKKDDVCFCTVGRLIEWKNHQWLIDSFRDVVLVIPKARLHIIGDGPERSNIENQVEKLGLTENVIFTGEVENPYQLMKEADIFVFPSRKEPFGRAVLEAMSLGLPIIAADSGGIPEFLIHGVSGLLVPLNNTRKLSETMIKLSKDGELCQKLAENARRQSEENFSIENTVRGIEKIYKECLNN